MRDPAPTWYPEDDHPVELDEPPTWPLLLAEPSWLDIAYRYRRPAIAIALFLGIGVVGYVVGPGDVEPVRPVAVVDQETP